MLVFRNICARTKWMIHKKLSPIISMTLNSYRWPGKIAMERTPVAGNFSLENLVNFYLYFQLIQLHAVSISLPVAVFFMHFSDHA